MGLLGSAVLRAQGPIVVSPTQLTFNVANGAAASSQNLVILSNGPTPLMFTTAATGSGSVSVSPASGTTPLVVAVSVNPASLTPGSYGSFVTLKSGDS